MSIGSRIKERREQLNLSRIDLAEKIGVTPSAIANYENEISSPKIELMYKLFDALDCDANYLHQDDIKKILYKDTSTPEEFEKLVKPYRSLDDPGRSHVDSVLNWEVERSSQLLDVQNQLRQSQERITELEGQAAIPDNIVPIAEEPVPDHLIPNAAHADDYANAPENLKQLEEDIMDDENF